MKILLGDCDFMNLFKKILNHSFWLLIGNSIGRLAMFLVNILAARILSQDLFGQYMMIRNSISTIEGSISGSIGNIVIKTTAESSHKNKYDFLSVILSILLIDLMFSLIVIVSLFCTAPFIVNTFFLGQNNIIFGLYMGGGLFAVSLLASSSQSMLIGLSRYKEIALSGMINVVISIPIIYFLSNHFQFVGILIGVSFYFLIDFIIKTFFIMKQLTYASFTTVKPMILNRIRSICRESRLLFLSVFISLFTFWYIRIETVNKTNSFNDIAVFDSAYQWLTIIMLITGATTSVALQMLSKKSDTNQFNDRRIFLTNLLVNFLIAICIAGVFAFFAKNIMSLYGDKYIYGYYLIYLLGIVAVVYTLSSLFNKLFIVSGEQKSILFINIVSSLATILFIKYINMNNNLLQLSYSYIIYYCTSMVLYCIGVAKQSFFISYKTFKM